MLENYSTKLDNEQSLTYRCVHNLFLWAVMIQRKRNFLLVANQDTDNMVVFKIDNRTGKLEKISEVKVPTPVCVKPYLMG